MLESLRKLCCCCYPSPQFEGSDEKFLSSSRSESEIEEEPLGLEKTDSTLSKMTINTDQSKEYTYIDKNETTVWFFDGGKIYRGNNPHEETTLIFDDGHNLRVYQKNGLGSHAQVEMRYDGHIVTIYDSIKSQDILKLKKKGIWVQEFTFSLKQFLLSDKESMKFFIINPKSYEIHDMLAKKCNDSQENPTVKISPDFLFGERAWQGIVTYDEEGTCLHYCDGSFIGKGEHNQQLVR